MCCMCVWKRWNGSGNAEIFLMEFCFEAARGKGSGTHARWNAKKKDVSSNTSLRGTCVGEEIMKYILPGDN